MKNKTFLKRVIVPDLTEKNFYIGAKLNIFGRPVVITAYEDEYTRNKLTSQRQMYGHFDNVSHTDFFLNTKLLFFQSIRVDTTKKYAKT